MINPIKAFNSGFKNHSRILLILFITMTLLNLTGCASHIDDPDPNSFELKTLTLAELAGSSISSRSSGVSTVSKRNKITIMTQYEKIDLDYLKMSGGKSSGLSSIMATSLDAGQTLRIDCRSKIQKGNLALIVLSPDRKILHQFAVNRPDRFRFTAKQSGIYLVRMGTESFTGEIQLERKFQ